jgi:GntR family transcriptional regulator/MocR family aminotransferase
MKVDPGEIVVVAGVAQALSLAARLLLGRGRSALAVEEPCSLGVRHQLQSWGLSTPPVPVGADGLQVDALARTQAHDVLVTPAHQFPTGVALSGPMRRDLIDWARAVDGLVIEDDYDAEHRYDRSPVPALAAAAPERTYYTGSVSKLLAPALRIGWVVPPRDLLGEVVGLKRETDLGNPVLAQLVLAEMFRNGALERHLRTARRRHQERRDALLSGLHEHLEPDAVLGVAAGLHLTLRLPAHVDETTVATELLEGHGIKVQPLSWHRQQEGPAGLVLGYATTSPDLLRHAGQVTGRLCS